MSKQQKQRVPQGKTPPHQPEAENAVLGGIMLLGVEALDEATEVMAVDDLYQPRAQSVMRAMIALRDRGEPIDTITVEAQLRRVGELELVGGIEGIARLDRYATAHNVKAHAQLIAKSACVRRTIIAAREVAEEGMGDLEDPDEWLVRSAAKVEAASAPRRKSPIVRIGQHVKPVMEAIFERMRSDVGLTGLSTGFYSLNEMTAGLQPAHLIILAARPSMGKTALALNIAANIGVHPMKHWVQDPADRPPLFPVLFFSLEMAGDELTERMICSEANVEAQRTRRGARMLESEFRGLLQAADRVNSGLIDIDESDGLPITEIRSRARRWRRSMLGPVPPKGTPSHDPKTGKGLGLIMVDYLQLARGSKARYGSREEEVADIARGLKGMAKELRVPVLALSQLNRGVDARADHRPMLSDLRESGAIEQDADEIFFLYREEQYLTDRDPEEKRREAAGKAELIIGKQRNGPIGTVPLIWHKQQTRFDNAARQT